MKQRFIALALGLTLLAGCGGYDDTAVPAPPTKAPAGASTPSTCQNDGSQLRSYEPGGEVGEGPAVDEIRSKGRLVAGVAADTLLLGARDPGTNQIEGFDIDMVYAIADEIFPESGREALDAKNRVELKVITAAQRIPFLVDGQVDIVARNMTVNCARWEQIAFSQIYYNAGQKVLVGKGSGITIDTLEGKRLCAPEGTTSLDNITAVLKAEPVSSTDNAACMVLFQNGEADGVSTDDTVLAGLADQDPYAEVLESDFLTEEPYGIGVNQDNVDLVQLINKVLEDMRDDGRWLDSYNSTLGRKLPKDAQQPRPVYGR